MKSPLFRFAALAALLGAVSAWAADVSPITPAGDGAFAVTVKAHHKFTRNTDKLKDEAMAAATQFCALDGKQLKVISLTQNKSMYLVGDFASVTLTFQALPPGEAEPAPAAAATVPAGPKHLTTDELGAELTKLDDLRKRGLINDAEFDALKQKVLSRY